MFEDTTQINIIVVVSAHIVNFLPHKAPITITTCPLVFEKHPNLAENPWLLHLSFTLFRCNFYINPTSGAY